MVNVVRLLAIAFVIISLIGGCVSLYIYSQDAKSPSVLFFQILVGSSVVIFIVGILLAFMSKNKSIDPYAEAKAALFREAEYAGANGEAAGSLGAPVEARRQTTTAQSGRVAASETMGTLGAPANPAPESSMVPAPTPEQFQYFVDLVRSDPELLAQIIGQPKKEMSFEEQMEMDKKKYYESLLPSPLPAIDPRLVILHEPPEEFVEKYQSLEKSGKRATPSFPTRDETRSVPLSKKSGLFGLFGKKASKGAGASLGGKQAAPVERFESAKTAPSPDKPAKVKVKLEWPFKKKENKLRGILEEEEAKVEHEQASSWRHPGGA